MSTIPSYEPGDPMPAFRIPPPPMAASAFWSTPVIKDSLAITTRTPFVCKMEDTAEMWRRILAVRFDDWSLAVSPVNSPLTEPPVSPDLSDLSDLSELDVDDDDDGMSSGSDIPFRPPPGLLPYSVPPPPPPPPPLYLFGARNGILNRPTAGGLGMSILPASTTQRGKSVNNASSSGSDIPFRAARSSVPYPPPLFVRQYLAAARESTRVGPIRRSQTRPAANPKTSRRPLQLYTLLDPSWELGPPTQIPRQVLSALRSTASHEEDTSRSDASTQPEGPVHPHGPATGPSDSEESPASTTSRAPPIVVHELGTAIFSPGGTETDSNAPSLTSSSSSNQEAPSDPYTSASPTLNSTSPPPTPPWKITDPALTPTYTLIQTKHDCRSVSMLPTEMLTLVMTRALPGHLPLPFLLLYCLPGLGYEEQEAAMIEWRDVKEHALHEISELVDRYTGLIPDDGERQRARTRVLADLHFGIATGSSVRMYDFDRGDDGVFLLEECAWAMQAGPRLNVRETPIAFSNLVDRIAGWEN